MNFLANQMFETHNIVVFFETKNDNFSLKSQF